MSLNEKIILCKKDNVLFRVSDDIAKLCNIYSSLIYHKKSLNIALNATFGNWSC